MYRIRIILFVNLHTSFVDKFTIIRKETKAGISPWSKVTDDMNDSKLYSTDTLHREFISFGIISLEYRDC